MPTDRLIDLSHVIVDGMITYPGLPAPDIADHLGREEAEKIYGPGITFQIGLITMCTNTGTYLDVPYHRFANGHDLHSSRSRRRKRWSRPGWRTSASIRSTSTRPREVSDRCTRRCCERESRSSST